MMNKHEQVISKLFDSELVKTEMQRQGGSDVVNAFAIAKETTIQFYGRVHGALFVSPVIFKKSE